MKKTLSLLLLALPVSLYAQQSLVIVKVYPPGAAIQIDHKIVRQGQTVPYSKDSKVVFPDDQAYLRGIIPNHAGILTLKKLQDKKESRFEFLLSEFIEKPLMATPGGKYAIANKRDLQKYFSAVSDSAFNAGASDSLINTFLVIDRLEVHIPQALYQMDSTHFFYVKVELQNGSSYNKKLGHNGEVLQVDSVVKNEKGITHPLDSVKNMTIYYLVNQTQQDSICKFEPYFTTTALLKKELSILAGELTSYSDEDKFEYIYSYLIAYYGVPEKNALKVWVKKELGITVR